ncbi:MAG TPA: TAT-variant-translocated molybdopterin oxidoreductase, partial [Pirellulaceae bacterium]|nr:TAT-variant-translocated molybdopterin oxidoreductase [Pirellulaceae bacterium]
MAEQANKQYWKSLEERDCSGEFEARARDEFPEPFPLQLEQLDRRGFLKAAGFTFAGAALSGCQTAPVQKAIPFLIKPEEITPGRALHYASTCGACPAACGLLVKNRDGRPIKLDGNPEHPVSRGGLCAVGQASILGLYDNKRLRNPLRDGAETNWEEVDREVTARLAQIREQAGAVRFLTGTFNSPTTSAVLERFLGQFPNAQHVTYDALSSSAILDAHEQTHGIRSLPRHHFDKADLIVSFDADFLGTWFSPVEHTRAYHEGRRLEGLSPRASRHIQFESRMSLTGTKADERIVVAPHELRAIVPQLAAEVAAFAGTPFDSRDSNAEPVQAEKVRSIARDLWQARGRSLVISGSQEVAIQALCNFINHVLGNYGATIDMERHSRQRQGSDRALQELRAELEAGTVSALLICGVNPVYELPEGNAWPALLSKVPLVLSFDERV